MLTRTSLVLGAVALGGLATMLLAACTDTSSSSPSPDAGGNGSSSGGSSSGGSSSGGSSSGGGVDSDGNVADAGAQDASDATVEANTLGALVDNMTAPTGTQNQMGSSDAGGAPLPAGASPGTYYAYLDPYSIGTITSALVDVPVAPPIAEADGSQIVGELCIKGRVTLYVGLGMSIAYAAKSTDASSGTTSSPTPYDASHYSGISFYIYEDPGDGGPLPQLHFGVPDTQTAGPEAWPGSACLDLGDGSSADCYDDFGSDINPTPGQWTKVTLRWVDLQQANWGAQYTSLKTDQLIAMKWQANGPVADSGVSDLPYNFCVSNIYFTP